MRPAVEFVNVLPLLADNQSCYGAKRACSLYTPATSISLPWLEFTYMAGATVYRYSPIILQNFIFFITSPFDLVYI